MNIYDKFFQKAKEAGIEAAELNISKVSSISINLYHGEIESVDNHTSISTIARGIYNGKFGSIILPAIEKNNIDFAIESIKTNAKVIEKDGKAILFKGSKKYHKVNTFNKDLQNVSIEEKKAKLFELEKLTYEQDKRIIDVESAAYSEEESENIIINSYGLKLKQKNNSFAYIIGVVAQLNDEKKTNWDFFLGNKFEEFNPLDLAKKVTNEALSKLGGEPIKTGTVKSVLSQEVTATLLDIYLGHAIAEQVQKHSSLFEGKLNTQVASKKLTISETPLNKTIFSKWFDDEGVATYNKDVIKNGVLKTYFYNLETAEKDGVETTGNGVNVGSKISTGFASIKVKPGKKSLDQLFESVQNGLYITGLEGTHAGINSDSGNFSLKCEGFEIKDGKKGKPVSLITVSGNIMDLFKNVKEVGGDVKMMLGGTLTPSIVIKGLKITGK